MSERRDALFGCGVWSIGVSDGASLGVTGIADGRQNSKRGSSVGSESFCLVRSERGKREIWSWVGGDDEKPKRRRRRRILGREGGR